MKVVKAEQLQSLMAEHGLVKPKLSRWDRFWNWVQDKETPPPVPVVIQVPVAAPVQHGAPPTPLLRRYQTRMHANRRLLHSF